MIKLIIITICLLMFSCAQKSGSTNTSFKLTMAALGAPSEFSGGLVIYGNSKINSDRFVKVMETGLTQDYEIPNGMWNFYAIGWDGSDFMTGKIYCAVAENMDLNGDPMSVDLEVSNAGCTNTHFGPTNTISGEVKFPQLKIETCNQISSTLTNCLYEPGINYTNTKGYLGSYRLEIKSFFQEAGIINSLPGNLISDCANVANDSGAYDEGSTKFDDLNIPLGNKNLDTPFSMILTGFFKRDCQNNLGVKTFLLSNGISHQTPEYLVNVITQGGVKQSQIFTKTTLNEVCSENRVFNTPYAVGLGTPGDPFVVCTPNQLSAIGSTDVSKTFVLGSDLDMSKNTSLFMSSPLPCTDLGDNFVPIGGYNDITNQNGVCSDESVGDTFTGNFDGLGFTIKNLRLEKGNLTNLGLFRSVNGGIIQNLNLENSTIEAGGTSGVLVGDCQGCTIKNIQMKNSKMRCYDQGVNANGKCSLIVGSSNGSTISKIYIYDSHIQAHCKLVGSITGYDTGTTISKALIENTTIEGDQLVGGIAGHSDAGSSISEAGFIGAIISSSNKVGGIAGETSNSSIQSSYVDALILTKQSQEVVMAGGIVGNAQAGSSVSKVLFTGKMVFDCFNATQANCMVGDVIGQNAGGVTDDFTLSSSEVSGLGGVSGVAGGEVTIENLTDTTSNLLIGNTLKGNLEGAGENKWTHVNGMPPRLTHELERPCHQDVNLATVNVQKLNGRGSETNPIVICNKNQLTSLLENDESHYILERPIRLESISKLVQNFNGTFNANNKILYDLDISTYTVNGNLQNIGLFTNILSKGVVKNLNLFDARATSQNVNTSFIAGINNGLIENVSIIATRKDDGGNLPLVVAYKNFGAVTSVNNGTIDKVEIYGAIDFLSDSGGVANINNGTIKNCTSDLEIILHNDFAGIVGGVVASNDGVISKCESFARIESGNNPSADFIAGGISGENTGEINNSQFNGKIFANFSSNKPIKAAGISGKSFAGSKIINSYVSADIYSDLVLDTASSQMLHPISAEVIDPIQISETFFDSPVGQAKAFSSVFDGTLDSVNSSCDPNNGLLSLVLTRGQAGQNDFEISGVLLGNYLKLSDNNVIEWIEITGDLLAAAISADLVNGSAISFSVENCPTLIDPSSITSVEYVVVDGADNDDNGFIDYFDTISSSFELTSFGTFCSDNINGLSEAELDTFKCSAGWDVATIGNGGTVPSVGFGRMINEFKKILGLPVDNSIEKPIWELQPGRKPELFNIR